MQTQVLLLAFVAAALYIIAAGLGCHALRSGHSNNLGRNSRIAIMMAAVALLAHAWSLDGDAMSGGQWHFDFGNSLSIFMWQCAVLLVLLALRRNLLHLGLVVFPTAAIAVVTGALWTGETVVIGPGNWALRVHIILSLLAYALLSLAAVQAMLLAWQDAGLHHSGSNRAARLQMPPLEGMEQRLFELIGYGFALLTLALASGIVFVHDLFSQHLAHKTVLSLVAWAVFAGLLCGRWRYGWRGRKAIRGTLAGYVLLLLAYFGSKFVLEVLLQNQWHS